MRFQRISLKRLGKRGLKDLESATARTFKADQKQLKRASRAKLELTDSAAPPSRQYGCDERDSP